jgi:List-Bact-rpt repeat protein
VTGLARPPASEGKALPPPRAASGDRYRRWTAVAVVALLLGSAFFLFAGYAPLADPTRPTGVGPATHIPNANPSEIGSLARFSGVAGPSGAHLSSRPAGSPVSSGRGTFFNNVNLSQPVPLNQSCFAPLSFSSAVTCPNTTLDPSINITPNGTIGVAFTAFTNVTHCASAFNGTLAPPPYGRMVDVAFQSSTTAGRTWSPIVYLGNQDCKGALNLSEAWQPSLTSLSNGTFVVTYTEFNISTCHPVIIFFCVDPVVPSVYPYSMPHSALVVQESYNGGATWTTPLVLNQTYNRTAEGDPCGSNTGSPIFHPWISATGNSVYLVYENISDANGCAPSTPYSAGVHLISSTDGGVTWGAPVDFPTLGDGGNSVYGSPTNFSVNPYVLAAPNGQVYVAYATGLGLQFNFCQPSGCASAYTQDLVVANATGGNGTWTVHTAATQMPFDFSLVGGRYAGGPFSGLHPQLTYNGFSGQLYLAYNSQVIGNFCFPNLGAPPTCRPGQATDSAMFQNSSNGGATWSAPTVVGNLLDPYGGPANAEFYPTVAVDSNGTVDVTLQLFNDTGCAVVSGSTSCGEYQQVYLNTTTDGRTWNGPIVLSSFQWSPLDVAYTGEYETAATAPSGAVFFAWTNSECLASSGGPLCTFGSPGAVEPNTTVVVSTLYTYSGVTLTLHETNLTGSRNWSADVMGNQREARAGTNLVVYGVPTTEPVGWSVPWVNVSYGVAWQSSAVPPSPPSPSTLRGNVTLNFSFTESVQVVVGLNPPIWTVNVTPGLSLATYSMSPMPGTVWWPVNVSFPMAVSPQPISCGLSCLYTNLTWVSWTGVGTGSVSSNATTIVVPIGTSPVNETANFLDSGTCLGSLGTIACTGPYGYPLTFVESGLPAGTAWGVTVVANSTANGVFQVGSTTPWLNVTTGQTAVQYTIWTVPGASSGSYWIPSSTPASPVKEPIQTLVNVTYALGAPSSATFVANWTATGLPNGTAWSADVGNASYAVTSGSLALTVPGGTPLALNGSFVFTENGVAYYASSVSILPYVENTTWVNATNLSTTFWFNGSARVIVGYQPMFWLSVLASAGGTVGPASRWVESGASVTITAAALPRYRFEEWTGAGAGSTTALQAHSLQTTINPTAPVTELATFRPDPQPTWNVTVTGLGLPAGVGTTFQLGNTSYSGTSSTVTVGELGNGSYQFTPAIVYANSSNGTRWVPMTWISSFGPSPGGAVPIFSNGTIAVNYTTEFVLTVGADTGGSVAPSSAVGTTWQPAGSTVELTATPAFHYAFVGWNASGPGAVSGASRTIGVTPSGPVWETATFVYRTFPPPAVFTLLVTETGLPARLSWDVGVASGSASAAGSQSSHNLTGLNGTYSLLVPAVYFLSGVRYVANASTPISVTVSANQSIAVGFTEQFAYTIWSGSGGTTGATGTTWVPAGATETLRATPAPGYQFSGWNGTGSVGAKPYTGPNAGETVVVTGPTNESATFTPLPSTHSAGATAAGEVPAFGLLVLLLIVGAIAGWILGKRRGGVSKSSGGSPDGTPSGDATGPRADSAAPPPP